MAALQEIQSHIPKIVHRKEYHCPLESTVEKVIITSLDLGGSPH